MTSEKMNILYERLSREDERDNASLSIENQKAYLEEYATRNGFSDFTHLTDDGWSGTRWDRPGFLKMMEEVERGNVVQRLRETKRRRQKIGEEPNPLTGVLYCADCGHKMYHKQGKADSAHKPHDEYVCSSYRHYTRSCTCHYIRVGVVENLILTAIQRVSKYARENENEFIERVREKSALQQETAVKESRKKLAKAKRRRDEVGGLVKKL